MHRSLTDCPDRDDMDLLVERIEELRARMNQGVSPFYIRTHLDLLEMRLDKLRAEEATQDMEDRLTKMEERLRNQSDTASRLQGQFEALMARRENEAAVASLEHMDVGTTVVDAPLLQLEVDPVTRQQVEEDLHRFRAPLMDTPAITGRRGPAGDTGERLAYLRIVDHLPAKLCPGDDEEDSVHLVDGRLTVRSTNTKKLADTSRIQWAYASNRIRSRLTKERGVNGDDYDDYCQHFLELAGIFQWTAMLAYDDAYRLKQTERGFTWGEVQLTIQTVFLNATAGRLDIIGPLSGKPDSRATAKSGGVTKSSKPCFEFNATQCSIAQCRYLHACMKCGGAHSAATCAKAGKSGQKARE
jgi:hypothetical protein